MARCPCSRPSVGMVGRLGYKSAVAKLSKGAVYPVAGLGYDFRWLHCCIGTAVAFAWPPSRPPPSGRPFPFPPIPASWHSVDHFLLRLEDVILLVDIKSPIYFWRNLLWLSSLSCSSFTASMRLKSVTKESCNALACLRVAKVSPLFHSPAPAPGCPLRTRSQGAKPLQTHLSSSALASLPRVCMSSLVRRGLMALTSSGPACTSTGPTSVESRGTIMVPLLLRLGSFGRTGFGAWMGWSMDVPDDESDQSGLAVLCRLASPIMD